MSFVLMSFNEIEHANQVFDTIEDILLENDLAIRNGGQNKWVSSGRCGCDGHDDSYFTVEVEGDIIDVDVIHEIEEALEVLHAKSVYIISRHERNHDFLELVAIQKFSTNDKTENNFLESNKE
jgi:hypothetical protein